MKPTAILTFLVTALVLTACDRKPTTRASDELTSVSLSQPISATKTLETSRLGRAIDSYERDPSPVHEADVEKAFADLAGEIAELQERIDKTTGSDRADASVKARNLMDYRDAEKLRFAKAKAVSTVPQGDGRSGAQKIEDGVKHAADKVEDAAKDTGNAIKRAAEKTGDAIKDAID